MGERLDLTDEKAHYLMKVMRLKEGDALALFNGEQGEWRADVIGLRKKTVELQVQEKIREYLPPPPVTLCFAPIKFGRIDFLVEKATELGAATLQPVITDYTQAERVNLDRLRAHAIEAAEQCERVEVPALLPPIKFKELLAEWPQNMPLMFGDEGGEGTTLSQLENINTSSGWALLVGPEGGFSPNERKLLYAHAASHGISLGPRILRADTAALTLLAITQSRFGDWHIQPHFNRTPHE